MRNSCFGTPPAAPPGRKRKGEPQEKRCAKRPSLRPGGPPANVLPAIFARSPALALRFPSLAGQGWSLSRPNRSYKTGVPCRSSGMVRDRLECSALHIYD